MQAARNHPINCGLATTSEFARVFTKRSTPGYGVSVFNVPRFSTLGSEANATVQDREVVRRTSASGVNDIGVDYLPATNTAEEPYVSVATNQNVLSGSGSFLTHEGDGEVLVKTTSAVGEIVLTRANASSFSSGTVELFGSWVEQTAGEAFTVDVESRLPASTENPVYGNGFQDGVLNMLLPPGPYATSGWTRNPNFWLSSVDWSSLSIRNSGGHARGGVLVSPRYAVCAAHFGFSAGESLTFLTADNLPRVRTVDSVTNFPVFTSFDTCLLRLSEPLTYANDGIAFCKVFPDDYAIALPGASLAASVERSSQSPIPVLTSNQDKLMGVSRAFLPEGRAFVVSRTGSSYGSRALLSIRVGDSGHPVFALNGGEPVLWGTWTSRGGGMNFTGNIEFQAAVNAVMAVDSESLTPVDLSGFPTY